MSSTNTIATVSPFLVFFGGDALSLQRARELKTRILVIANPDQTPTMPYTECYPEEGVEQISIWQVAKDCYLNHLAPRAVITAYRLSNQGDEILFTIAKESWYEASVFVPETENNPEQQYTLRRTEDNANWQREYSSQRNGGF